MQTTPLEIVGTYIRAKDGNRPLLMRKVFAKDSELQMNVKTDAISFPSSVKGLEAISNILVSRFAVDYEVRSGRTHQSAVKLAASAHAVDHATLARPRASEAKS